MQQKCFDKYPVTVIYDLLESQTLYIVLMVSNFMLCLCMVDFIVDFQN
jgi:hypothetical protein